MMEGWLAVTAIGTPEHVDLDLAPPYSRYSRPRRELVSFCAHAFSMLVVGKTSEVFCQPCCTLEHPGGVLGAG